MILSIYIAGGWEKKYVGNIYCNVYILKAIIIIIYVIKVKNK